MGRAVEITRRDLTAEELREEAGCIKDGRVVRRMLAIALVLEGVSRQAAAQSCGMDRQTLRDWRDLSSARARVFESLDAPGL